MAYNPTIWICHMADEDQKEVADALKSAISDMKEDNYFGHIPEQLFEDGMAHRLCNLENTIDITRWTQD